jgi:hypothetical protein
MSAGLGGVPAEQTYLDITQGNRIFDSLYGSELSTLRVAGGRVGGWASVIARARSAPAEIVPGLLGSALKRAGVMVLASPSAGAGALLAADREGRAQRCRSWPGAKQGCASALSPVVGGGRIPSRAAGAGRRPGQTLEVRSSPIGRLPGIVSGLRGDDLLIAIQRPPPAVDATLAIGIAGRGFNGNLTSNSTRINGYVLATDIAPTILRRFGLAVPAQISGQPIRAEQQISAASLVSLGTRLRQIPQRRGPVIGLGLGLWIIALGLMVTVSRGRAARLGVRLLGLSVIYLPFALLVGGALESSQAVEQLLVVLGAPLAAVLTLGVLGGFRALAVASALTVLAYALDMVAGSRLTVLSLLGPNPGLGVRFYGIGNELEALLAVLIIAGTGAALVGFAPRLSARGCAIAFLAVGLPLAAVFAVGQFGADVGAAIDFPVGAAVAAATIAGHPRRRILLLVLAAPFVAVGLLALADLASGANAHLTRSVLDAGGFRQLADLAQLRLELSVRSFVRPIVFIFMPLIFAFVAFALLRRDRLGFWLRGQPAMRAGLIGAVAATVVGTLANDSGALFLEIGAAYVLAFTGYVWAEGSRAGNPRSIDYP